MSLFPFVTYKEDIVKNNSFPLYKEVAWDFKRDIPILENGDFKIVEGNEAIKVWILKTLLINRYEFEIFSWDYGSEIESLIGKGFEIGFIKSETQRYIEEALLINPYITKINKIDVEFSKDVLTAYVDLETVYGRLDMYV